jgi:hypothetical protein
MTGRAYERPERHNEYFIPGDGISREVIQADICRYLGNDALVKPGTHQVRCQPVYVDDMYPRTITLTLLCRAAQAI